MIQIWIKKDPDSLHVTLRLSGHANTAPSGQDTVCAAVSALVYGYAKEISLLDSEKFTMRRVVVGDTPGEALVETVCANERTYRRVLYNLAPLERSLEMIEETNREAVQIHYT